MKHSVVFLLAAALLVTLAGSAGAHEHVEAAGPVVSAFSATPFAEQVGLGGVTGNATFDSSRGSIFINLHPNGAELPEGVVLEGWVVDLGRFAGHGYNASVADQGYGPPFGNLAMDVLVSAAPYALSTGVIQLDTTGNWSLDFHIPNYNFSPYDAVVITAESDGNAGQDWDPRPGAPFFSAGMREDNAELSEAFGEVFAMVGPAEAAETRDPIEVILGPTPLAANASLEAASGSATLYSDGSSAIDFSIHLNGSAGPEGCLVLEGWVVDAGLFGGPGESNSSVSDEAYGPPFGDVESVGLNAAVEAAPYALSTGVAADRGDGTFSASYRIPGYNFGPFDAFVVTLESDCNAEGFDPRPGTPVLIGMIHDSM
ncbi:MAG: hypothetical protein OXH77_04090 [Anaerolineaceae bacterium]|nr:hypothetical protein [Anaerolineaceae bacterium]